MTRNLWQNSGAANDLVFVENGKIIEMGKEEENKKQFGLKDAVKAATKNSGTTKSGGAAAPSSSSVQKAAEDAAAQIRSKNGFDLKKASASGKASGAEERAKNVSIKDAISEEGIKKAKAHEKKVAEEKKRQLQLRAASLRASIPVDTQTKTAQENAAAVRGWMDERRAKRAQEEKAAQLKTQAKKEIPANATFYDVVGVVNKYANDKDMLNAIQSVLGDELEENRKLYHKYGDENVYFNEAEEDILNGNIPSKYAHLYDYDAFKTAYNNHQKSVLKYDYVSDILQGNFYAKSPVSENGIDLDYAREQAAESAEAGKLLAKSTKPRTDTAYEDYVKKNGGSFKNALYAEAEGAEDIAKEIEKASDFYEKHADNTYNDNLFGRIAANYRQGDIGVRSGDAGYVSMKHKDENLVANDIYDFLADRLYSNNIKTFTNNTGFDEFVANNAAYAPQFLRQLSANVKGQIEGGFAGAVVGYGVAGPAGVATGALEGRKYGAAYESAKFMYKQTAGGAYVKALRETGNVELAYEMAKDEALASAAIEYAMELAVNSVFGAAGLLKKPFNNVLEEAGKKISTALVKKGISKGAQKSFGKVVRVVADGLVNMITEPTEEYLQEGVSIRAEQALAAGEDTNPGKLILRAMQSDSYTADDIARMNDAKDAAIMLAFLGGSVKLAGTGRDVYVDTKTQKAVDTVQAFDYMTGNARMEFDNLTPGAQKIVKQEFSDRPQELQNFIKQQSPTASISKEAQAAVDDMLSPLKKKTTQSMQGKIVPNMDDNVRSKVLKQKKITTVVAKNNYKLNLTDADIASLQTKYKSAAKPILKRIAEQFGLLGKRMDNKDIQVEFIYSTGSLNESIHRQHKEYETFAKMLTVFDDVVKNAVGVEVHKDKYFGTQRATPDLKNVYVLASAFFDGNEIVPVQLEVKEFRNQDNKLYLSVCLKNKTEAGRLAEDADNVGLTSAAPTASTISISEILENVNPEYGDFLKYFPDSMLSKEQIEAKNAALAKEAEYLESIRKDNSSSKSDTTPAGVEDFDVQKKGVNPELQKQLDDHIIVQSDGDVQKVNPELQKSIADHEAVFEKKKAETENELFSGTDREIETKVNELLAPGNAAACAKLLLDDNIQHVKGGYLDTNAPRFREVFFTQYRNVIEKLLTAANTVVLPTNSDLKKSFVDFAKRYIQANCKASPEMRADYFKEIADILNYQDPDGFTKENYPYYERVYYENLPDLLSTIDTYVQTVAAARMVDMGIISPKTRSNQNIYFAVPEGKRKFELQHPEGNVTQQEDKKEDAPQIAPEEISKLDVSDEVKRAIESPHIKVDISEAFAEKAKKLDIRQRGKLAQLPRNLLAKFFKVKLMDEPPSMLTRDIRKRCEIAAAGDPELEEFLYDGFLKYVDEGQKIGTSREMRDAQAVYKFMNEIGIKPDSKEDAAAQMLGEGYWQDQYGERHTYTLQDVKREFPKTWGKIVQLKDFVRSVYDRLGNEGNRDLKIIYPDAISYYEAEMEKKWTRIEELRDKPGYVQSRIRVFENEIAKLQRDIDNLQKRKESKSDVRQSLDAIEGKKEAAVQSFEARKRKDTKAAAADEAKVARYEDKARSVQRTNDAYIDNQIEALERKKTRLEADIRKQKQKISDASLANDAKQISRLELEIRDIENGLDTGELIRDRRILIRDNYFHHRKAEKRSTSAKFIALLEKKVSIDPELVGTSRETKPKRRFEGIMQHQGTDDYTPGALAGLLEYIPQVHRMTSSDYVLAHGRE
ncbi:MAG: hypothetical protein IJD83_00450, partial [Clostridia bacterium]|nr:hypothetical protein [Clostridia bacterium]